MLTESRGKSCRMQYFSSKRLPKGEGYVLRLRLCTGPSIDQRDHPLRLNVSRVTKLLPPSIWMGSQTKGLLALVTENDEL